MCACQNARPIKFVATTPVLNLRVATKTKNVRICVLDATMEIALKNVLLLNVVADCVAMKGRDAKKMRLET